MLRFSGVLVVLVLASQRADGQPTHDFDAFDDFFHWRDDHDLLEQIAMNLRHVMGQQEEQKEMIRSLQRVILQHEEQHEEQEKRTERLEQMMNETVEGQRRMEMQQQQQVEHQVTRYVSLQQQHQQQQLTVIWMIHNMTAKLEALGEDVNTIRDTVDSIKQHQTDDSVSVALMTEFRNVSMHLIREQQSVQDWYDQNRQNQSAELMEMIADSITPIRQGTDQIIESIKERSTEDSISATLMTEFRNLSIQLVDAQHSKLAWYDQKRQNESIQQLEMITGSMAPIRQGMDEIMMMVEGGQNQLLGAVLESRDVIANNLSMRLTDIGMSCINVSSGVEGAIQTQTQIQGELLELYQQAVVSNLSKLFEVAHAEEEKRSQDICDAVTMSVENITTYLIEIQEKSKERLTHDMIVNEQIVGIVNNLTQSQQQMFCEVSIEVDRKMNETLIMSTQSHAELVEQITDKSNQIQSQLTCIQEDVRAHNERELLDDNITVTLADIEGTCVSIGSRVNTTEETLVQEFQEQRHIVSENAQLLGTLNQTWVMSAEQSLQQQNNAFNDITNQLVAIHGRILRSK